MPELTRRRATYRTYCWLIYFGDVHVGTISRCVGNPNAEPQWQWLCGFYPGSDPGEQRGGTAPDFDQARETFAAAWRVFSAKRTEADYKAWRDQRDFTARKYAMWERGEKFPSHGAAR
jgi:hypothetical protein